MADANECSLLLQFSISNELLIYSFEAQVFVLPSIFVAFNLPWWSQWMRQPWILNAQKGSRPGCRQRSNYERPGWSLQDERPKLKPPKLSNKSRGKTNGTKTNRMSSRGNLWQALMANFRETHLSIDRCFGGGFCFAFQAFMLQMHG